jgi:RES domain-containing protein
VRLWRISRFADLSGEGGRLAPGRWHSRGGRIVYLADHPASALVEVLVHLEVDAAELPTAYQLLDIEIPDTMRFETMEIADLPDDWQSHERVTRALGDRWLAERRTGLLRVPSAIVPATSNWLLNSAHADARALTIAEIIRAPFDQRLRKMG